MNIIGKLVYLRAIEPEDNRILFELINDQETEEMVGGSSWPVSRQEQEMWQTKQIGRKDVLRCMIVRKDTDDPVGTIILSDIDSKNGVAQIHIKITKKNRAVGLGTDALKIFVRFAFFELRLNCLFSEIISYNTASISLFERCGFSREGILRDRVFKKGNYYDVCSYSIISKDLENIDAT